MEKPETYKKLITLSLATVFGTGFIPIMPGTFGSLVAVGLFTAIRSNLTVLIVTAVSILTAFLVSGKAERIFKKNDPKQIVIDETAGQLTAYLFIPAQPIFIIMGFILFRMFDIFKIYPANIAEKRKGSLGIVGDDLIAGIYANLCLHLIILIKRFL